MIRQLIAGTEAFALRPRAHSPCDIELLGRQIIPYTAEGVEISRIMRQGSYVRHSGIEVAGTNRMTDDFLLLEDGHVVLAIGVQLMTVSPPPCFLDEVASHIQVLFISRYLI